MIVSIDHHYHFVHYQQVMSLFDLAEVNMVAVVYCVVGCSNSYHYPPHLYNVRGIFWVD